MSRSCPKGQILRKSYTRKSYRRSSGKRVKGSRVPAKCIRDLGSKGKGRKVIIDLQKGSLTNLGYKVANNVSSRRSSLKKAVDKYGSSSVIHKLNVLNVYNKRKSPQISKKVKDDMKFVRKLK
jgi:hypothetical protein